jgi:AMP-binding enzyme
VGDRIVVPLDHLPGTFFGPSNLVELVRHRATYQPDDIAFTYLADGENEQIHLTNSQLDREARAIGAWLESLGLVGGRALLLYPPGLEFISAFFGCLYAGVVAVPVYPPRRNRSLERIQAIADDAQVGVALTTDVVLRRVEPLIDATPHLKALKWLATCHVPQDMDQKWEMPDMETCRQVVEAVEKYLGKTPRRKSQLPVNVEVSPDCHEIELFPEYIKLRDGLDLLEATGLNPYFNVHESVTNDRTMIDGLELINFSSYNYVGMSGDPAVVESAARLRFFITSLHTEEQIRITVNAIAAELGKIRQSSLFETGSGPKTPV